MKYIAASLLGLAAANDQRYMMYMAVHGKSYLTREEYDFRKAVYDKNMDIIEAHNLKKDETYTMGEGAFTDWTWEEFERLLGYADKKTIEVQEDLAQNDTSFNAAWPTIDHRANVSPVKNQGQCGSCWSFSTTGALEFCLKKKTGTMTLLSEQQLVDCSTSYGNHGCNGGLMDYGFKYAKEHGLVTESEYPYTATDGSCKTDSGPNKDTGYTDVSAPPFWEDQNKNVLAALQNEAIAIAVAANSGWQHYTGGIFTAGGSQLNHGVLLVGSGTDGSTPYYRIKNSWGASWGEEGYIRVGNTRSTNSGLTNQPSYPSC